MGDHGEFVHVLVARVSRVFYSWEGMHPGPNEHGTLLKIFEPAKCSHPLGITTSWSVGLEVTGNSDEQA